MTTSLWSYTRSVAWRRHSATWHGWIDHLRSTLTPQLVKTHLPAWWTFTAVTRLLTLVNSTRQLVYKWITTECQNDLLIKLTLSLTAMTQSLAASDSMYMAVHCWQLCLEQSATRHHLGFNANCFSEPNQTSLFPIISFLYFLVSISVHCL